MHDAAVRVFAQKGFSAAGVRELAQEAGLTSAALYHYMGRKEDLLVDIMKTTIEPLATVAENILPSYEEPAVQLAILIEVHVWMHGSRPSAALIADTELRSLSGRDRTKMVALRDRYESLWRSVVKIGMERGIFELPDERIGTNALLELCNGVSLWYSAHGRLSLEEVCSIHADLGLGMVRASSDGLPIRREHLDLPSPASLLPLTP